MKKLIAAIFLLGLPLNASAQSARLDALDEPRHGAAYLELFGNGQILPSLGATGNVELKIGPHLFARLGAGTMLIADSENGSALAMVTRVFPQANGWAWEASAGIVRTNEGRYFDERRITAGTFSVGVRRHLRGHIARITFTPITGPFAPRWKRGARFVPAAGISVGKTF